MYYIVVMRYFFTIYSSRFWDALVAQPLNMTRVMYIVVSTSQPVLRWWSFVATYFWEHETSLVEVVHFLLLHIWQGPDAILQQITANTGTINSRLCEDNLFIVNVLTILCIPQYDVVIILYWGNAFLYGNCLPQVDEPL